MASAREARFKVLAQSQTWRDLTGLANECVQSVLQAALSADSEEEASVLLTEARAAHKFAFKLTAAVEAAGDSE